MLNALSIFIGCGLGGVARWSIARLAAEHLPSHFPWGTAAVNIVGSFVIGVLFVLFNTWSVDANLRLFSTTGFLGGFTTFSTFALETVGLAEKGYAKDAFLNALGQTAVGIAAAAAGMVLGGLIAYLAKSR